jgi:NAD(P)-dependent dehydrogenase (short-subunit alcohol dehydrogenase family)
MNLGLHDKVVVVTGGSKGSGYACAVAFAQRGAIVPMNGGVSAVI